MDLLRGKMENIFILNSCIALSGFFSIHNSILQLKIGHNFLIYGPVLTLKSLCDITELLCSLIHKP